METQKKKNLARQRRHIRVRAKVQGTSECPRLSVFRSARYIYAQLIDDVKGVTLVSADDHGDSNKKADAGDRTGKIASAFAVGKSLAEKALAKEIKKIVFDRGGYKYHGRVKALAEGAREGGMEF
jgi:large subunit ribosomal protein L18